MSDSESGLDNPDLQLEELTQAKDRAWYRCHHRTAMRLAGEIKRAAKAAPA